MAWGDYDNDGLLDFLITGMTSGFEPISEVWRNTGSTFTNANVTISWSSEVPGWLLQETLSLSPVGWSNSPSGATNPITVPAATPTKFYRLFKP